MSPSAPSVSGLFVAVNSFCLYLPLSPSVCVKHRDKNIVGLKNVISSTLKYYSKWTRIHLKQYTTVYDE